MHRSSLVLACAALVAAAPLAAQQTTVPASSTKGFFIGAHLNGSSVTGDDFSDGDSESGPGVGIQLGFGFTRQLAIVLDGTGAGLDVDGETVGLGHFDVGLRYAFTGPTRRFVPFVEAAFTGRALEQSDVDLDDGETGDVTFSGTGFTLGGGVQYYVAPKWAVGAGLKWTTGEFDTVKVDNVSVSDLGIDAKSARINFGVTWYPMAGR
jgi:opacity protein-like surface antigen